MEETEKIGLYKKILRASQEINLDNVQLDRTYTCTIIPKIEKGSDDSPNQTKIYLILNYQFISLKKFPSDFIYKAVKYYLDKLKELIPEFLSDEHINNTMSSMGSSMLKINMLSIKFGNINFDMSDLFSDNALYFIRDIRPFSSIRNDESLYYTYNLDEDFLPNIREDLESYSHNLRKKCEKVYNVLRKGTVYNNKFNYELPPTFTFFIKSKGSYTGEMNEPTGGKNLVPFIQPKGHIELSSNTEEKIQITYLIGDEISKILNKRFKNFNITLIIPYNIIDVI
jgi:hypothetical protein